MRSTPEPSHSVLCTAGVAWTVKCRASRNSSRPSVWSSSASVSSTDSSGVVRASSGCSPGQASIWVRTSGEALIRNHRRRSTLTATDDWVRGGAAPERTAAHTGQPQFHCGEPPPAAEPRTRSHTLAPRGSEGAGPDGSGAAQLFG